MVIEQEPLSEKIDHQPNPWVIRAINYLHGIPQEDQWRIVAKNLGRAAHAIGQGRPVLFSLMDDTLAGGMHMVQAVYDPGEDQARVREPRYSKRRGGNFASVLHTLEVIAATVMTVNADGPNRQPLPFPEVNFTPALEDHLKDLLHVVIPLTVDPPKDNILAFHPQVDRISPEALALSYYETIQNDAELPHDLLRHTKLVHALHEDGILKHEAGLRVLMKGERAPSKLLHPERIAHWRSLNARPVRVKRI